MTVLVLSRRLETLTGSLFELRRLGYSPLGTLDPAEAVEIAELRELDVFVVGDDIEGEEATETIAGVLSARPACRLVRADGPEWIVDQVVRTGV